jgi:hypothetical protein
MARFRKKPVEIEARQLTPESVLEIRRWASAKPMYDGVGVGRIIGLRIHTLEGDMKADFGDWIIRGIQGEFYPCKPDIFEATYEAV